MSTLAIILIFVGVILIGLIGWIKCLRDIRKEEHEIDEFCGHSLQLQKESKKNKFSSENLTYIISKYAYISQIIPEHYPHMPVYDLGLAIRDGRSFEFDGLVNQIRSDTISSISSHERSFDKLLKEWWNVFNHFFRGVGIILRIILGYPIQMIKPEFNFQSKGWNAFCAIIGLFGSIASILSLIIS